MSGKGTPIMQAVAYPAHMFYAPLEVWIANLVLCAVLASSFEQPLIFVTLGPAVHFFAVQWYRRDPHIVTVCAAALDSLLRRAKSPFSDGWTYEA